MTAFEKRLQNRLRWGGLIIVFLVSVVILSGDPRIMLGMVILALTIGYYYQRIR